MELAVRSDAAYGGPRQDGRRRLGCFIGLMVSPLSGRRHFFRRAR